MLSAPATIPATSEATFNPALAPLSPGTLRCSPANVDKARRVGQREHRDQPAADNRFGSSKRTDLAARV